ncbi:hypothetical protein BT96DRAFT_922959, partial [Gymnopus androsaceus JB14]
MNSMEKPSQIQLQRLEAMYASRARAFSLPPGNIHITSILDDILLLQPKLPLLPNLITLNWNELSGNMASDEAYAALFMHDGVRAFKIMHDSVSTAFPDLVQHSPAWDSARRIVFFGHISERMPNLDTLGVFLRAEPDLKKPLLELIGTLPRLRIVILPGFSDPIAVFSKIQDCCDLEQVSFSIDLPYRYQPTSVVTQLTSISPLAFHKLEALSLSCGLGLASSILRHLFSHNPRRLINVAMVSELKKTPFEVQKLCEITAQVGNRLKKLCLVGLQFYHPSHTSYVSSENVVHFEDIKPIVECSNLESFELGYPFDLPWQEKGSIALAWPRLKNVGFYVFYAINPEDTNAVKVRTLRLIIQKALLGRNISDSKEDILSIHNTFNSINAFPMTHALVRVIMFLQLLHLIFVLMLPDSSQKSGKVL